MCASLGRTTSCSQLPSGAWSSWCRVKGSWAFPCPVWHGHWCHPGLAHIWVAILMRLYGSSCWRYQETQSHSKVRAPPALRSLPPLFCNVPWALGMGAFCRCFHWDWTPQLWILIVVFCSGPCRWQRVLWLVYDVYDWVWICAHERRGPWEDRREHWVPWSWTWRKLWAPNVRTRNQAWS